MTILAAVALAVWVLYALDRILDSRHSDSSGLMARHLFHREHRATFLPMIVASFCALGALVPQFPHADIRLYSIEALFLASYFGVIHLSSRALPKELLVGPFFSVAIFIPTVSADPQGRLWLLPLGVLFAALCSLNCLYIHAWEHPIHAGGHWATKFALRNLSGVSNVLLGGAVILCLTTSVFHPPLLALRAYPMACAASVMLLRAVHQMRWRLSPLALRVAADAALLTPVFFMPFLRG